MKRDPKTYLPRERAAVIAAIEEAAENGKNVVFAARALGITAATYYRWVRERAVGARPSCSRHPDHPAPRHGRGYADPRKRELLAEIQQLVTRGLTIEAASRTVGISGTTYHHWIRSGIRPSPIASRTPVPLAEPSVPPMRPVELVTALVPVSHAVTIAPPLAPVALTLIAPGGYRIEGLTTESAAALLRALT